MGVLVSWIICWLLQCLLCQGSRLICASPTPKYLTPQEGESIRLACKASDALWFERENQQSQRAVSWYWTSSLDKFLPQLDIKQLVIEQFSSQIINKPEKTSRFHERVEILDADFEEGCFSINITNLQLNDSGVFFCKAWGNAAMHLETINLTVHPKVPPEESSTSKYYRGDWRETTTSPSITNVTPEPNSSFCPSLQCPVAISVPVGVLFLVAVSVTIVLCVRHSRRSVAHAMAMEDRSPNQIIYAPIKHDNPANDALQTETYEEELMYTEVEITHHRQPTVD
uniref:Uncharacterized protein LOC116938821 n=1 Tax=Petromyzon marinus TaxID=7757 RepID=A0AAJ7WLQ8_PETMA|nr:uncharacterized protein LOC116938821 [Petromyzon marinus]